jgi:spore coat polysaccharide biosynthesis predicted glycosyltransferase SpsG
VLFLCEAAQATGLGHFVRSMALASELARRGTEVHVLLRPDALDSARTDAAAIGTVHVGDWSAAPALAAQLGAGVVVDSYGLGGPDLEVLHGTCAGAGRQLVVIDDLADRDFPAHVVVNQNLGAERLPYPRAARVLAGPRHALLRPVFPAGRPAGLASAGGLPDEPGRVLVLFGGTDASGTAQTAALAALAAFPGAEVRVVLPAPQVPRAELLAEPRATVLRPLATVHQEMLAADLVVSAGGTTLWELCCLARAVAVVAVADNQVPTYDEMVACGHVLPAGRRPETSPAALATRLAELVAPPGTLRRVARSAATVTDGAGCARVADVLVA